MNRERVSARLSPLRLAAMTLLLLGTLGTLLGLVRALPLTPAGRLAAGLLGVVAMVLAASPIEWLVHRYVYHRRVLPFLRRIYVIHHRGHHQEIFPTWRYVTNGPVRRHPVLAASASALHDSPLRNLGIKLAHFSFYMVLACLCIWLPSWFLTGNAGFLLGVIVASIVVSDLFVRVHDAIHYPGRYPLLERQAWVQFLDRHHYIHHVDTEANVNFLLPLADWLFGTLRRSLRPEELARHGSLEQARAHPLGRSEPARQVAAPRLRHRPASPLGEPAAAAALAGGAGRAVDHGPAAVSRSGARAGLRD